MERLSTEVETEIKMIEKANGELETDKKETERGEKGKNKRMIKRGTEMKE